ncbi:MAG: hypothetical protein WAK82_20910 [Streptosporangiaceae bacterium]
MPADTSLRALRDANPRNRPGFDADGRYEALRAQIVSTPRPAPGRPPRLAPHRRVVGLSAAGATALAAAAVVAALMLSAASPPSAYAAATKALAATTAAASGTQTATVVNGSSSYTLDTTRWNGTGIALTRGQRSVLGTNQQLLLVGGGVYVQTAGGTWLHYASASDVGPRLGPAVQLARDNAAGNTAGQILSLATGLQQATQPDGTTIYTGTIPDSTGDPGVKPGDDELIQVISDLRSGNEPGAPGGYHNGVALRMTVGPGGLVQKVSLTFRQQDTGSAANNGTSTWTVTYSQLGSTPPITAPSTGALAQPVTAPTPTVTS